MSDIPMPQWAQFDARDYVDAPDLKGTLDVTNELAEQNDDPESLAACVYIHRVEIVALRNEIERLRGYARHLLLAEMHDISEGSSCAGWLGDWASDLWACLLDPALDCGLFGGELSHWTDVDRLVGLIRDAQCWWDYDSNNTLQPIPLVKWEAAHGVLPADIIERHEAADAAKKRRENNNG